MSEAGRVDFAEGGTPLEAVHAAVLAMIADQPEDVRERLAVFAGLGEQPAAFPLGDGMFRVEFGGVPLGVVGPLAEL